MPKASYRLPTVLTRPPLQPSGCPTAGLHQRCIERTLLWRRAHLVTSCGSATGVAQERVIPCETCSIQMYPVSPPSVPSKGGNPPKKEHLQHSHTHRIGGCRSRPSTRLGCPPVESKSSILVERPGRCWFKAMRQIQ